ncbi:MAG TPA: hypothetical protein VGO37_15335 [Steroidobacteraceae bacterium]|jgi:hypothetical protein|nr:hypothetical protein [Steroidobacteraceae bacterium]
MSTQSFHILRSACVLAASLACGSVGADVTIEQKTTLDVASMIRTHGSSTTNIAADKKREDTESHCEGMLSLVCGNVRGGEIVRLDRGLTWKLEPEKKSYREDLFATPEDLAQMRAKMQARLEKMRSCPVSQKQQPIDKSKCEMSPPKIDVRKTDDKMSIAGHDAQRTLATLTETCTNRDTGEVCDTVVAVDLWLTQDKISGAGDRRAFDQAYARKLGLDDAQGALRGEFAKFLAPYQSQIKQLTDKSSDLKGQPLKTTLRVMMGGAQCGSTAKMKESGSASGNAPSGPAANPMNNVAQAGKALGSALGGLFHKKKADDAQAPASSAAPPDVAAAAGATDPYSQYAQMAAFTTETVTINTDAVPAERFEVPTDWKKEVPRPSKQGDDDFTCPKTGS